MVVKMVMIWSVKMEEGEASTKSNPLAIVVFAVVLWFLEFCSFHLQVIWTVWPEFGLASGVWSNRIRPLPVMVFISWLLDFLCGQWNTSPVGLPRSPAAQTNAVLVPVIVLQLSLTCLCLWQWLNHCVLFEDCEVLACSFHFEIFLKCTVANDYDKRLISANFNIVIVENSQFVNLQEWHESFICSLDRDRW